MNQKSASRSGVTLVEMMVSILLLFIIFCCWSAMNNIQAVRKESLRYAAVEKAAGILDAMATTDCYENKSDAKRRGTCFRISDAGKLQRTAKEGSAGADAIYMLWPDDPSSPIGYRILQTGTSGSSCWTNGTWGVVSLFSPDKRGRPVKFSELRMLLDSDVGSAP